MPTERFNPTIYRSTHWDFGPHVAYQTKSAVEGWKLKIDHSHTQYLLTRSLGALRAPTSSWSPFGPLDFVLRALWALRPCDPRKDEILSPTDEPTSELTNTAILGVG